MSLRHLPRIPWFLVFSLALNVIFIVGFIVMLLLAQHYYKEYRVFRPMAHGTSAASTLELTDDRPQQLMVMLGDSRVLQWQPHPPLNNTLVVNAGAAGETTIEVRRRLQQDVLRLQPDIVLIQVGVNDLTLAATRGIDDPAKVISEMKSNIDYIVNTLIERNIRVIVTPVLPASPLNIARKMFWRDDLETLVSEANDYLKSLSGKNSLQWIDIRQPLYDDSGALRIDWYADALHLVKDRYTDLNVIIVDALNNH